MGPDRKETCAGDVWLLGSKVVDGEVGLGEGKDRSEAESRVLVAFLDGDDGAWGDVDEREQVVVRGGSGLRRAIGMDVDKGALESAVRTVFGHLVGGGGESLGDGAGSTPGDDVFCLASRFIHLFGGGGNVYLDFVANVERGGRAILI